MQPERAVVLVGKARVGAVRVEHLEQAVEKILAVRCPFISILGQESTFGQQCAAVLRRWRLTLQLGFDVVGDIADQALKEAADLAVCGGPVTTGMGVDRLIQMSQRHRESKLFEQL